MPFSTTWSLVFRTKFGIIRGDRGQDFLCNVKLYEYQSQEVSSCLQNRLGTKKSWNLPNRINMNHCIIVFSLFEVHECSHCLKHLLITKRDFSWPSPIFNVIQSTAAHNQQQPCMMEEASMWKGHRRWSAGSLAAFEVEAETAHFWKVMNGEIHAVELSSWIKISQGPQPTSLTGNPSRSRSVFDANCASFMQPPNCA